MSYLTTGLPPAPEKMEASCRSSGKAWENLVDEYLASLILKMFITLDGSVRYAETMGHNLDYGVSDAWLTAII
ncbi:MAG: hypothetical protein R3B93_07390 [Bacteroidia bacterium]